MADTTIKECRKWYIFKYITEKHYQKIRRKNLSDEKKELIRQKARENCKIYWEIIGDEKRAMALRKKRERDKIYW